MSASTPTRAEVRRSRELAWAGTVGLVLADSSIVTLALPAVLRRFGTSVFGVSWVLIAFNVVLALAVVPAARAARRHGAAATWTTGLAVFAAASLLCALAPEVWVLIVGRCVQAAGGAAVVAGAIELLAASRGSHRRAAPLWGAAGMVGLALGPAAGGFLTEVFSWQAIFALQVPVVLAIGAVLGERTTPPVETGPAGRLELGPETGLALISAGLTGALFLLVIMLTEAWGLSPLEAAAVVSVMPLATIATRFLARGLRQGRAVTAAGAIAMAGGLAGLGVLPGTGFQWAILPQALVGAGIALALPGLTERALASRDPDGRRAAATIAARHAGIVLGILALTPIFTAQLGDQERAARRSGTALLLDAPLAPKTKIGLSVAIGERIDRAQGRLPRLAPAFRSVHPLPESRREYARLRSRMQHEVEKAGTHAFSLSFLAAGLLGLLAALAITSLPLRGDRQERSGIGGPVLLAASAASAALVGAYLLQGGATYRPLEVADPCEQRHFDARGADKSLTERLALSALDGAACRLRVPREDLALALADRKARARFGREHHLGDKQIEAAARAGLKRAIDDADRAGAISGLEADLLRRAADRLPVGVVVGALRTAPGGSLLNLLEGLIRRQALFGGSG